MAIQIRQGKNSTPALLSAISKTLYARFSQPGQNKRRNDIQHNDTQHKRHSAL
jgi:hypothetical protein